VAPIIRFQRPSTIILLSKMMIVIIRANFVALKNEKVAFMIKGNKQDTRF